ncbi:MULTISPECIES: hypothetical protein [Bizionia]|uniref:Uncharacterized protein n=1 Tax=Bizionia algoritergicola TaxID=291187 RepID=A0A5D0QNM0_9FLAO|nr:MULTISPECIES: hypothetical protein [Bizionia]TYB70787.1 hypothetical protein ES675_14850 [Bizionia algoritergicola]
MKWDIKPNQSSIFYEDTSKSRSIKAIVIDVDNQTVKEIDIKNYIDYLQRLMKFYNYEEHQLTNDRDFIFINNDSDRNTNLMKAFFWTSNKNAIFGNAIIVKIPKSGDYNKLQSTKLSLEEVKGAVTFGE